MYDNYKHFFRRFISPHTSSMAIIVALSFVGTIFSFITPLLSKSLIDEVFIGGRTELVGYVLLGTIGSYIISSLSAYVSGFKKGKLDLILFNDVSKETFNTIQFASIKKTQEMKIGDLLSRIVTNTRAAISMFTYIIPEFAINIIRLVSPLVIMLLLNIQLTIIVLIPALFILLPALFFGKRLENTQRVSLEKTASIYSFLKENLSMIPLIKVFGLEMWSQNKFNDHMRGYYDASIDYTRNSSLNNSVYSLIQGVPIILLILFGAPMVVQGKLTLGTFAAFMSYVALFFVPITQFAFLWSYYKSSSPALDRVNEVLQMEQDDGGKEKLNIKDGMVEFNDVWFSYDNRPILQGFNATFKKGLNYMVGDNGTGKSTVLKLLCSLYPLEKGEIKIDGQHIARVMRDDLRKNVSLIFSDPYLFDGSIYENISIGKLSASKEEITCATKLVRIHKFIMSLPRGYETLVGENGLKLSSGEKQKIALARAVLKNSPIILLDEVTKSIDAESRKSINEAIRGLRSKKTIIVVTHNTNEIEQGSNIIYLGRESHRKDSTYRTIDIPISKVEIS